MPMTEDPDAFNGFALVSWEEYHQSHMAMILHIQKLRQSAAKQCTQCTEPGY